mmetsp:Transcript_81036/g.112577  ORF Transcript_81036/g.112577 Transcript_81036/m.112577 type:complete len:150 (+) Transcript_81036:96-545(+)
MSLAVLSAGNNESQTCLQVPSRSNETVKADKRQRAAVQSLAGADVLQLLLQQVFERASLNGVVVESFYLQQQIQWEMEKYPSPRSPPKTMRNLHKLLSRMSLKQMVQFVRRSPLCDRSFLDDVQTQMASLRPGTTSDLSSLRHPSSVWL